MFWLHGDVCCHVLGIGFAGFALTFGCGCDRVLFNHGVAAGVLTRGGVVVVAGCRTGTGAAGAGAGVLARVFAAGSERMISAPPLTSERGGCVARGGEAGAHGPVGAATLCVAGGAGVAAGAGVCGVLGT